MARGWVSSVDAFRAVPKDLAEATPAGAVMTIFAIMVCCTLFVCEITAFMTARPRTDVVIDSNQDSMLRINFDVHLMDLACDYVAVGVWDAFGTERMNISSNVQKQRIDHKGKRKGSPYSEDEIVELEFKDQKLSQDEKTELDADWSSSSDQFKHDDFQAVIDAHDFTMVNFYADWCPHCRMFAAEWMKYEERVNKGEDELKDADGIKANVRVLKINCVDFEETCQQQRIQSFPTIRLFRRGMKDREWQEFNGPREINALAEFTKREVKSKHMHTGAEFHEFFTEGCRISGHIEVVRVPGTLHFQATHTKDRTLNLAFTNVSHHVHHFSFGEAPRRSIWALPQEYKKHVNPLDGRSFTVEKFHQAPHHFIKVVHTRFESMSLRSYQQTHQWSVRTVARKTIPQAKFSYDLSPVEVVVSKGDRRWYDFITSLLAIIGGAFTVMSMTSGMMNLAHQHVKASINKLG